MNYSVCIDALYFGSRVPIEQQIKSVCQGGFDRIEFWSWWDKDITALERACREHEVKIECFCTKLISLVDPRQEEAYLEGLRETLEVAKRLSCTKIISQIGNSLPGIPLEEQFLQASKVLKKAARLLEEAGCTLLVEPLNTRVDHQGYILEKTSDAVKLLEQLGEDSVRLLFDIYHQQITEGDLLRHLEEASSYIGHLHAADNPGRDRPGSGEICYQFLIQKLHGLLDPSVVMGLEYFPAGDRPESLKETRAYLKEATL